MRSKKTHLQGERVSNREEKEKGGKSGEKAKQGTIHARRPTRRRRLEAWTRPWRPALPPRVAPSFLSRDGGSCTATRSVRRPHAGERSHGERERVLQAVGRTRRVSTEFRSPTAWPGGASATAALVHIRLPRTRRATPAMPRGRVRPPPGVRPRLSPPATPATFRAPPLSQPRWQRCDKPATLNSARLSHDKPTKRITPTTYWSYWHFS